MYAEDEALAVRLCPSLPFFVQNRRFLSYSSLSLSSDNVLYACLHRLNSSVAFGFLFLSGCVSNALFLYAVLISFFERDSYGGERLRIAYKSSSSSFFEDDADAPRGLPPHLLPTPRRRALVPARRRPRRRFLSPSKSSSRTTRFPTNDDGRPRPRRLATFVPVVVKVVKVVVKVVVIIFVVVVVKVVKVVVKVVLPGVEQRKARFLFSLSFMGKTCVLDTRERDFG